MRLIKKVLIIYIFIIFFINNIAYSINYKTLNIEIPNEFVELNNFYYQSDDGKTINITYSEMDISVPESEVYTENNLNDFVNEIKNAQLSEYKSIVRKKIEETYGEELSNEIFEKAFKDMEISLKIDSAQIVNIGTNKYKAFKVEISGSILTKNVYQETYIIFSKTGYYNIYTAALEKSYFSSTEYLNMINSIDISNPLSNVDIEWDEVIEKSVSAFLSVIIISVITIIYKAVKNKDNKKSEKNDLIKCKVCGKEISYNEYGTCEECYPKILNRIEEKNNKKNIEIEEIENDEIIEKNKIISESQLSDIAKNKLKEELNSLSKKDILDIIELYKNNKDKKNKRFCTNCGKEIDADWKFCKFCGHKN